VSVSISVINMNSI